nr:PREDICTED: uncharacterized protein LOC109039964 [Bemisia tabaci]
MNFLRKLQPTDKVLILGEGNFSFATSLLQSLLDHSNDCDIASIVATCLEPFSEEFSVGKKRNIAYLKKKGVTVLFGVDVNHLDQHFTKGTNVFTKVIFNFPHVGGKMKIHLNRVLLSQIFKNVTDYVSHESNVCITLCDGQGGTGADSKLRRYDDSWQVVEMAAMSNFALKVIEPFPVEIFPNYRPVGYRGYDKGFCIDNSLLHIFQRTSSLRTFYTDCDLLNLFTVGKIHTNYGVITCIKLHSYLYSLNLFAKSNSAFHFIFQKLKQVLKQQSVHCKIFMPEAFWPIHKEYLQGMPSFLNGRKVKLCSSLSEMLESAATNLTLTNFENTLTVVKSCCFKELSQDLESSPTEGQIMILGCDCFKYTMDFLESLKRLFKYDLEVAANDQHFKRVYLVPESSPKVLVAEFSIFSLQAEQSLPFCTIFCDSMAKCIFKINHWQEIWSENTSVVPETSTMLLASLYPSTFKFDVNFLVTPDFRLSKFYELMWNFTLIAVINVELISKYIPDNDNSKMYLCFRVYYKSFIHPFCRTIALEFHQNVVSKGIQVVLNAPIC